MSDFRFQIDSSDARSSRNGVSRGNTAGNASVALNRRGSRLAGLLNAKCVPADLMTHRSKSHRLVVQALQSNDGANRESAHTTDALPRVTKMAGARDRASGLSRHVVKQALNSALAHDREPLHPRFERR